jgi:hypothetical protein
MQNGGNNNMSKYDKPILPPRKCHDCGIETYNYWCDDCREKRINETIIDFSTEDLQNQILINQNFPDLKNLK